MNIPLEIARAQAAHGIKGAAHGIKGGRPRLGLSMEERKERRRRQQEAYRRKKGIQPRVSRPTGWTARYIAAWGKPPGVPLTPEEYALREPIWNADVLEAQEADRHREAEKQRRKLERQKSREGRGRQHSTPPPSPAAPPPRVGRNQPCPCGSGRKSKKCCGG